jgi:neutral ceramidase
MHCTNGYIQEFLKLAKAMAANETVAAGATPADFSRKIEITKHTFKPEDEKPPSGKSFGSVLTDVDSTLKFAPGSDMVSVTFVGGAPRNNLRTQGTYLEVQQSTPAGWVTVAEDGDVETRFHAKKVKKYHEVEVQWHIPADAKAGTYRLVYYGTSHVSEGLFKKPVYQEYNGTSSSFAVAPQ